MSRFSTSIVTTLRTTRAALDAASVDPLRIPTILFWMFGMVGLAIGRTISGAFSANPLGDGSGSSTIPVRLFWRTGTFF